MVQLAGRHPATLRPEGVARRGHQIAAGRDDADHRGRGGVLEQVGHLALFNRAGRLVESGDDIAHPNRFDGPPIDQRAGRETLVLNPQADLLQPRLVGRRLDQRVHAGHHDAAVRLDEVALQFIQMRGRTLAGQRGRADDPVAHALAGQGGADLRDQLATVRDGADGGVHQAGDAAEDKGLATTGRQHAQAVAATTRPERHDVVDQGLLVVAGCVHLFRSNDVDCSFSRP